VASRAVSALCEAVAVIRSIEAAACCRLLACSTVRWLRSAWPVAICAEPVAIESALSLTCDRADFASAWMPSAGCISPSRVLCAVSTMPTK
jgi:hypothetical protein